MKTVTSQDGTIIAFDQSGRGPAVILVDGALQYRAFDQGMAELADLLSQHFTVIHYDRHSRGDSTDELQFAFEREEALNAEIEDIEAIIDEMGGAASLYGISSGAALAMEAAIQLGNKVKKLAMYEAPYNDDDTSRQAWKKYTKQLGDLLAAGRKGDAVKLFVMLVGAPPNKWKVCAIILCGRCGKLQRPAWRTTTSRIWVKMLPCPSSERRVLLCQRSS